MRIEISSGIEGDLYAGALNRVVRWEPDFITIPLKNVGKNLVAEVSGRARYRGVCIDNYELCAIFQPVAAHG